MSTKRIYLSPSNQNRNTYATGGTNEMAQCDKIAAATAKALKRCGFEVMVAKSGTLMQTRCPESDKFGADIHMPIHTNAFNGKYTGGTRVFCLNSNGRKAAEAVKNALGAISPGKDDSVSYKTDLYEINVPRALTVYVECEFHDTVTGSNWIRNNTNAIAEAICKGMCKYFGYKYKSASSSGTTKPAQTAKPTTSKPSTGTNASATSGKSAIKTVQKWVGATQDGVYGSNTKKCLIKKLQSELNKQFGLRLAVDGIFGVNTKSAVASHATLSLGMAGNITKVFQGLLICNGYSTGGFDGVFGNSTKSAVKSYQSKHGLTSDGIAGAKTFAKICG